MTGTVYAGVGHWQASSPKVRTYGFFRRRGGDDGWQALTDGLPENPEVRAIELHPGDPGTVLAGTQDGVYRSDDGGDTWTSLALPGEMRTVWSIAFDPRDADTVFVGVEGFAIWRTRDGGAAWERLDVPAPGGIPECPFATRVTRIAIDPNRPDRVYAGLEVLGVVRSLDGGDSWDDVSGDLLALAAANEHLQSGLLTGDPHEGMVDIHAISVSRKEPGKVYLANRMGLFSTEDAGESWTELGIGRFSPVTYARDIYVSSHDPERVFAALSPASVSDAGALWCSDDGAQSWRRFDADLPIGATLMKVAESPLDPGRIYCGARNGQVFGTEDAGATWRDLPLPDGVSGIYAMACA